MASRFVVNNEITFTGDDIVLGSVNLEKATDLVGEELSADELQFSVFYDDSAETLRNEAYAVPVVYYENEVVVGTFYLTGVTRIGAEKYTINASSMVGMLKTQMHYGGMYTATGFRSLFESVVLSDGLGSSTYHSRIAMDWITVTRGTYFDNGSSPTVRSRVYARFVFYGFAPSFTTGYAYAFGNSHTYSCGITRYKRSSGSNQYRYAIQFQVTNSGGWVTRDLTYDELYNRLITVDIRPTEGTATIQISGVATFTFNISSIQSTSDYINNAPATSLFYWGGGSSDGAYFRSLYYRVYNTSGNYIMRRTRPYYDITDNKFYWHDAETGSVCEAVAVADWAPLAIASTNDPVWIPVTSGQVSMVSNITYLNGADSLSVSGWLKAGTKRELLYQLLFAMSLNMRSNDTGRLIIGGLSNGTVGSIPSDNIYMGGNEKKVEKTRRINLTEHVYTSTTNAINTFDNRGGTSLTDKVIEFEGAPVVRSSVAASGLTLKAYNCNAAIVSGIGYTTGYEYEHSTIVHEYEVSPDIDGRDVTVSEATLVTYLNVNSVMNRLKAFYNNQVTKIENAIVYGGEQCGSKYSFNSPFGDVVEAFLAKMSATVSTFAKIACTFYRNYVAPQVGTEYSNYVLLTNSGTWSRPSGVTSIRVVLIGGGNGGDSGFAGEDGGNMTYMSTVYAAEGGNYGSNGTSGKIYEVDISSPAASYSYSCGAGGSGGAACASHSTNNPGSAGGATTFGSYSSADGEPLAYGHMNLLNGFVYGGSLPSWNESSGKGGNGAWIEVENNIITKHPAEDVYNFRTGVTYHGGADGVNPYNPSNIGGGGGGACAYADGGASMMWYNSGGVGGNGGEKPYFTPQSPTDINSAYYGYGGIGGFGGGGGGYYGYPATSGSYYGKGGKGGKGGSGAKGCVIIYY